VFGCEQSQRDCVLQPKVARKLIDCAGKFGFEFAAQESALAAAPMPVDSKAVYSAGLSPFGAGDQAGSQNYEDWENRVSVNYHFI
jgi:hypothetical protein